MKNILKGLFALLLSFMFIISVDAASATISVSSSSNQIIVGKSVTVYVTISSSQALGSWEYTLNYDPAIFKLTSSDVGLHYASYASNASTKSITYKYNFQALKSGGCNFYVDSSAVVDWNENLMSVNNGSKKVNTLTNSEYQATLSANNNLKNLEIKGYEISPNFDENVTEYSVKVNEDETKVVVSAQAADNTASVSGTGEIEVSAGNNTVSIVVIAQNGSEKTYKLNIEVVDKDPIEVKIDEENYTVVKLASNLTRPQSYTETKIIIEEFEVPAFYSEVTEFTLVGLKDSKGDTQLFIYNDGKYERYVELSFGSLTIFPLNMQEEMKNYVLTTCKISKEEIQCLEQSKDSRYKIINGLNVETKEEGLYLYDVKDNTLIKYNNEYLLSLEEKNTLLTYSTFAFVASTVLATLALIVLPKKKRKKKVKIEDSF